MLVTDFVGTDSGVLAQKLILKEQAETGKVFVWKCLFSGTADAGTETNNIFAGIDNVFARTDNSCTGADYVFSCKS